MTVFNKFLEGIDDRSKRERMEQIFTWIRHHYPHLKQEIKWNQPMYTEHGTFIIGFSVAKNISQLRLKMLPLTNLRMKLKKLVMTTQKN